MESKWAHPLDFFTNFSTTQIWCINLAIWAAGLTISVLCKEDWFSRSGALSIAFLLIAFTLDARKDPDAVSSYSLDNLDTDRPISSSVVRQIYREEYEARSFVRHEGYIAAFSTLIWGFGDLPIKWIST